MSLLISADQLMKRRSEVRSSQTLKLLMTSLSRELDETIDRKPFVPTEKAKLTRAGGRCPRDGAFLEFDPFSPQSHRCPVCGASYSEEHHYLWWVMSQQLFLAERAVHGALLNALDNNEKQAGFARSILATYAEQYASYPNSDNVLGPTKLFFSTYLESIWLLQICVALDLLELADSAESLPQTVREKIIAPSSRIIAMYDEGGSNRQAWNSAALIAASQMLNDRKNLAWHAERSLALMQQSLLPDGSWYEGENYHLFAHRGLWYVVNLCRAAGLQLPDVLLSRFQSGFTTPFRSALPDMTLLSRRDSPYAISLRQWRFAELCELGMVDTTEGALRDQLTAMLARLYAPNDSEARDTGRSRSTAEVEKNFPGSALTRSDVGWKSLMFASPDLNVAAPNNAHSVSTLLEAQGLAIFRRAHGEVMVALDYGHHGGGHGHPDRLNISLATGANRWLDDMGTGSYVDPSLFWYRSGLSHNAPFANWRTQSMEHGALRHYEDDGTSGFLQATWYDSNENVAFSREVVVRDGYCVDVLSWASASESRIQLPLHLPVTEILIETNPGSADRVLQLEPSDSLWQSINTTGVDAGLTFVSNPRSALIPAGTVLRVKSRLQNDELISHLRVSSTIRLWSLEGPAAPGQFPTRKTFLALDVEAGREGVCTIVHAWSPGHSLNFADSEGETRQYRRRPIAEILGDLHQEAQERHAALPLRSARDAGDVNVVPFAPEALQFSLGEQHYRRSELDWKQHDCPRATITLHVDHTRLVVRAHVHASQFNFAAPREAPYLDNENPDINSDGVQIHINRASASNVNTMEARYLLVPEENLPGSVRVTCASQEWCDALLARSWNRIGSGYVLEAMIDRNFIAPVGESFSIDVIVNLLAKGRERRSGQLIMSGALPDEWIYLAGNRQAPHRLLSMKFADG